MLKFVFSIPLIMHGLANLAGVVAPWTSSMNGFRDAPWLFGGGIKYRSMAGRASSLLWLLSTMLLCGAGIGLLLGTTWWAMLAICGAAVSLLVILIWWRAVPPGARLGAFVDAILLVVLLSPLKEQILNRLE